MSSLSVIDLSRMEKAKLNKTYAKLIQEKMSMDKFFSTFLDENKLDHDHLNTPQWKTYKQKLVEYARLTELIKWAEFYKGRK